MASTRALVVVATLAAAVGVAMPAAQAVTSTVRYVSPTGSDTGTCATKNAPCKTIGYAVTQTAKGDTVKVGAGHYAEAVTVTNSISIVGAGAGKTVVSGDGINPGFTLGVSTKTTVVHLSDLSVSRTNSAGIVTTSVHLTLDGVAVDHNQAGTFVFGGSLKAEQSSFSQNSSSTTSEGLSGVGLLSFGGAVSITDSQMDGNDFAGVVVEPAMQATDAGLRLGRTVAAEQPDTAATPVAVVRDSSISNNHGPGFAGLKIEATLTDDTLANNQGAGVYVENTTATLTQVTITGTTKYVGQNDLRKQAGIVSIKAAANDKVADAPKKVTIVGSIDAGNTLHDCNTRVVDGGYNLSMDKANLCRFRTAGHDLIKTKPKLGTLGHHGGFARTVLPARNSLAVNAVPLTHAGCVKGATDQRGVHRPQPTGGRCDIGSVELIAKPKS